MIEHGFFCLVMQQKLITIITLNIMKTIINNIDKYNKRTKYYLK